MTTKSEPWYIHAGLYAVIVILIFLLVKIAILDPKEIVQSEKYNRTESRLRMKNLIEAQILWQKKYGTFTDKLDSLVAFVKYDPMVDSVRKAVDTVRVGADSFFVRSSDPFKTLINLNFGKVDFNIDSITHTPKSGRMYIVQLDTTTNVDTVVNQRGKLLRVDSSIVIGSTYYIEDPDGYGTVGDTKNPALKNTASWD
ncbi:MAG: hypothetical protein IPM56_06845 [Ignavibacteriales bacterium]|nr:MAG: hypothetical protein IPM56_06845 [Ignavibacteriales bacterium]